MHGIFFSIIATHDKDYMVLGCEHEISSIGLWSGLSVNYAAVIQAYLHREPSYP